MLFAINNFFVNIMSYVNVLFENELIIYLGALIICAGMIGLFVKLLKINR